MTVTNEKHGELTILLSTYNGERFLQQQLDSLYRQTYVGCDILVRDDGSSDGTPAILSRERSAGRLRLLESRQNLGAAQSFFELLRHAVSADVHYVAFCDQDDVWLPDKLRHAVDALSAAGSAEPALYCSRLEIVDEQLGHIAYSSLPRGTGFGNAVVENIATGCTIVMNREALALLAGKLPERVLIHDWWCYLVVSCFGKVICGNHPDVQYRQHGANTIGVATGVFGPLSRKFRRFFGHGQGRRWISEQVSMLLEKFGDTMPLEHRRLLERFVAARTSLRARIGLASSGAVWRQKWFDDLILRVLILIGRV